MEKSNKMPSKGIIPEGSCVCSVCGKEKDNSEFCFYKNRITSNNLRLRVNTNCKSCQSIINKRRDYLKKSVTEPKPQPGTRCSCCGRITHKFEFDHDHETGEFRGYVCKDCNVGFGKFGDSLFGLLNAVSYLARHKNDEGKKEIKNILDTLLVSQNGE